jgi:acetylglutamate kinase
VNKRLVGRLLSVGVRAVGLSGEDGGLLTARVIDRPTLGEVGEPELVTPGVLQVLMSGGYVPVVSPLGSDRDTGATLNVNGDDAAAAIASALGADELVLVADVPGVIDDGTILSRLDVDAARTLIASGAASGGMIAKLEAAFHALDDGVPTVRIGDITAVADLTRGTKLTLSPTAV